MNLIDVKLGRAVENQYLKVLSDLMTDPLNPSDMYKFFCDHSIIFVFNIFFIEKKDFEASFYICCEHEIVIGIQALYVIIKHADGCHPIVEFFPGHKLLCVMVAPVMLPPCVSEILVIAKLKCISGKEHIQIVLSDCRLHLLAESFDPDALLSLQELIDNALDIL